MDYKTNLCHPDYDNIFNAFKFTPLEDLKVVILGQDPYHEINQAHGLAFSVLCEKLPPSLVNIYKEIASDLNKKTGVITSDEINGATPSAFLTHVPSRHDTLDILKGIATSKADLVMGKASSVYKDSLD